MNCSTNRLLRFSVLAFVMVCMCAAANDSQQRPLELVRTVPTSLLAPGRYSRFRCDADHNIYLRTYTGDRRSPVLRISPDGKKITVFELQSDQELSGIQDFWVTNYGDVYVLADKGRDEGYVVTFDSDGKYKETVRLEASIRPNQIAVFSSGDFLVAGRIPVVPGSGKSPANGGPFVGIFNNRGQFLKRIEFHKDLKPGAKTPRKADLTYADAIVNSSSVSSDDGTVYFMRDTKYGPVYAVSPSGTVTRIIRLKPPEGARLSTVKIARGRLAAEFLMDVVGGTQEGEVESVVTQIIDLISGKKVEEYRSAPPLGPDFVCYEPNSFTFLTNDENGYLQILEANGR